MHLDALLCVTLVDAGVAHDHVNWVHGPLLVRDGEVVDVESLVVDTVRDGSTRLRSALGEWGMRTEDPVWIADQPAVEERFRQVLAGVTHRNAICDLAVTDRRLLLLQTAKGVDLRVSLDRLTSSGSRDQERIDGYFRRPVADVVAASPQHVAVALADVVAVRMRAGRVFSTWRCVVDLGDRTLILRHGSQAGTARLVARLMAETFGDDRYTGPARLLAR